MYRPSSGKEKALVLGSSHVKRFRRFLFDHNIDMNLGLSHLDVQYHGTGGLLARDLIQRDGPFLLTLAPKYCFLIVGGNDLSLPDVTPQDLSNSVIGITSWLTTTCGVSHVFVAELLHRFASPQPEKGRPLTPGEYNLKVDQANALIQNFVTTPPVQFWKMQGLYHNPELFLDSRDQTHLTEWGNNKLMRNIRGALIHVKSL